MEDKPPPRLIVSCLDRKGVVPAAGPTRGSGQVRPHTVTEPHCGCRLQRFRLSRTRKETPEQGACHRGSGRGADKARAQRRQPVSLGPLGGGAGGPAQGWGRSPLTPSWEPPLSSQCSCSGPQLSPGQGCRRLGALWRHSDSGVQTKAYSPKAAPLRRAPEVHGPSPEAPPQSP